MIFLVSLYYTVLYSDTARGEAFVCLTAGNRQDSLDLGRPLLLPASTPSVAGLTPTSDCAELLT